MTKDGNTKEYALVVVKRWSAEARDGREYRDAAILNAYEVGATLREIAAEAGMTHQGIAKILKKFGNSVDNDDEKAHT